MIHLAGGKLVLPDRISGAGLSIEKGIISGIGKAKIERNCQIVDTGGLVVLPGYIDIHNHGGFGFDFTLGLHKEGRFSREPNDYIKGIEGTLKFYSHRGTTKIYATTLAASIEDLELAGSLIKKFKKSGNSLASMIGGVNLEGTFIKMPEFAGAQNPAFFYPLEAGIIKRVLEAFGESLKIVNVPPEHGSKGLNLIRRLCRHQIVVSGGHSGASAKEYCKAVEAGLTLAVHFLNGPSRSSTKIFNDGGAVEAMLREERVSLELIPDGYHVHPGYIRDTLARKGADKIILITDSLFLNGAKNIGTFEISGVKGEVHSSGRYLQVKGKKDTLFGSVLSPDQGFSNMLNWLTVKSEGIWYKEHPALSFEDAMICISKMMSGNPARLLGIYHSSSSFEPGTGSIEIGKRADLVVVKHNRSKGIWKQQILGAMVNGKWIYKSRALRSTNKTGMQ